MRVTIFGATGGVGRELMDQALATGHLVTAVARDPRNLPGQVRVVRADLASPDPGILAEAVAGAEAVLSCLGPRSRSGVGIASRGTRAIIEAMKTSGVRRVVAISAAPVGTVPSPGHPTPPKHDPGDGFFMRHLLSPLTKAALGVNYADLALMEDALRESGLDWTIVRPPRLSDKALTASYRIAYGQNLPRGLVISRADVAHLMLAVLERPETVRGVVAIAN
jgi:uncharacterized protein YbjT (DUF2867 family)